MPALLKAREPFEFYTRLHLTELTGMKAATLGQLLGFIKKVPGSSIYHHTHRFLQQHQYFSPEPPNDFAYWVTEVLGEDELGEQLASIDIIQYSTIRSLREEIIRAIEKHLQNSPFAKLKFARNGEEFHFMKSISFVLSTGYCVNDLKNFVDVLRKITVDSIYFHVFESRLRLERAGNDFSNWIEYSLEDKELAREISGLDPYTQTLENLRKALVRIIEKRIAT
jgi:hypothetical protein